MLLFQICNEELIGLVSFTDCNVLGTIKHLSKFTIFKVQHKLKFNYTVYKYF